MSNSSRVTENPVNDKERKQRDTANSGEFDFILFQKLLNICYVSGIVVSVEDVVMNKVNVLPSFLALSVY